MGCLQTQAMADEPGLEKIKTGQLQRRLQQKCSSI